VCNLVEINGADITSQEEYNDRVAYAAFIATLQAGYTNLYYLRDVWRETIEEEALIGVGITGVANERFLSLNHKEASDVVKDVNANTAILIGINPAKRTTTIKPAGTTSIVLKTSSGIHAWHDKYFVRRMRIGKEESIYKYLKTALPDLMEDEYFRPNEQGVLSMPIKAPEGAITREESSMDLLERIKKMNTEWVQNGTVDGNIYNNVSATVSVKKGEWDVVRDWMWANKETYAGISLLPEDGGSYKQTPFESLTKDEFDEMLKCVHDIDLSKVYELTDNTSHNLEVACGGGSCETDVTPDQLIKKVSTIRILNKS